MSLGAIVVPAYTTNTEDDHKYIWSILALSVRLYQGAWLDHASHLPPSNPRMFLMLCF